MGQGQSYQRIPDPSGKRFIRQGAGGVTAWRVIMSILMIALAAIAISALVYSRESNPVFDNLIVHGDTTVLGHLNYSLATVNSAPEYIIVGQGVSGVEDFPLGSIVNKKRRIVRDDGTHEFVETRHSMRSSVDLLPTFPSLLPIPTPFPPVGAVEVATIADAMTLLQNKVITNTTILLRSGTYNENLIVDGFDSNCGATGSNDASDPLSVLACRGVTIIGDNRRVAGYTWAKGAMNFQPVTEMGSNYPGFDDIVCTSATSIQIPIYDIDLTTLGIVSGDKINIYNIDTEVSEIKTVTSVTADTFNFAESGCSIGAQGSSVTFMPNRIIQGQAVPASDLTGTASNLEDVALRSAPAMAIHRDTHVLGLWVRDPEGSDNTLMPGVCLLSDAQVYTYGIVCDGRRKTTYRSSEHTSFHILVNNVRGYYSNTLLSGTNTIEQYIVGGYNGTFGIYSTIAAIGYTGSNRGEGLGVVGGGSDYTVQMATVINGLASFSVSSETTIRTLTVSNPAGGQAVSSITGKSIFSFVNAFGGTFRGIRAWFGKIIVRQNLRVDSPSGACINGRRDADISVYHSANVQLFNCTVGVNVETGGNVFLGNTPTFTGVSIPYSLKDSGELIINNNVMKSADLYESDGALNPDQDIHRLGGAGPRDMTLPAAGLGSMLNRYFTITSMTNESHVVTLTGGAVWPCGNTKLMFPGKIGASIECFVHSSTQIGKCTASWHLPPPTFIVVGSGVDGVEDWPTLQVETKKRTEDALRDIKINKLNKQSRSQLPYMKRLTQTIPVMPSIFDTISLPPAGTVYYNTFQEAMASLHGMVVTNTTIFLRAGEYHENFLIDGIVSNCDGSASQDPNENQGPTKCQGLNIIGDARIIAGHTYVDGTVASINARLSPLLGSDGGVVSLTCLNSTAISVEQPATPFWSAFNTEPDFELLGVVAEDKIVISNVTDQTMDEKTIVSVSGNVISFEPAGCILAGDGSTLTFLPNRKIVGQAPLLQTPGQQTTEEAFSVVTAALNVQADVNLMGLHITAPNNTAFTHNFRYPCLFASSPFVDGLVCDHRSASGFSEFIDGIVNTYFAGDDAGQKIRGGAPYFNQDRADELGFNETGGFYPSRIYSYGEFTALGGSVRVGGFVNLEELHIVGGSYFSFGQGYLNTELFTILIPSDGLITFIGDNSIFGAKGFYSYGDFGVRVQWNAQFQIYTGIGRVRTASNRPCLTSIDTSSMSIVDPLYDVTGGGISQFIPAFSFKFENCATTFIVAEHRSSIIMDLNPMLVNVASTSSLHDTANVVIDRIIRPPSFTNVGDGDIDPQWRTQYLDDGERTMTIDTTILEKMINKEYSFFSLTNETHSIALTGATWNGVNTKADWPATPGTGLTVRVLTSTLLAITGNVGPVTFSA